MTVHIEHTSNPAQRFNWLLQQFAANTPDVIDAIAVSSDGLLMAMARPGERTNADRLAAITSAIISLAHSSASVYDFGAPNKVIADFDRGYLLVSAISVGSALGVVATRNANLGNLAYDMAVFANRAGAVLTPQLIEELKNTVG
ncbi:MAG: roadblock/LC7 domain-containing protein [Micromonosporaceae bacterium]|nr:roadblock/LC7 domain-containing protein [Micromonosporaceae bacterium]